VVVSAGTAQTPAREGITMDDTNEARPEVSEEPHLPADASPSGDRLGPEGPPTAAKRRRRGSRGGQNRKRPEAGEASQAGDAGGSAPDELPEPMREGRVNDVEAADKALVRKPKIGDTRSAPFVPAMPPPGPAVAKSAAVAEAAGGNRKRRRGRGGVAQNRGSAAATGTPTQVPATIANVAVAAGAANPSRPLRPTSS
jgi:hypothetical protein